MVLIKALHQPGATDTINLGGKYLDNFNPWNHYAILRAELKNLKLCFRICDTRLGLWKNVRSSWSLHLKDLEKGLNLFTLINLHL